MIKKRVKPVSCRHHASTEIDECRCYSCTFKVFLTFYSLLAIYGLVQMSQWAYDSLGAMILIALVYIFSEQLYFQRREFLLLNVALSTHLMGTFGAYGLQWSVFTYDQITHSVGSFIAAYLLFHLISASLHQSGKKKLRKTIIDRHKFILLFLVISSAVLVTNTVEIVEYAGFRLFEPGDGLFLTGIGDSTPGIEAGAAQYDDTLQDMILNALGALIGTLWFYKTRYVKKDWMRK